MNKIRLNQILDIMLLPLNDTAYLGRGHDVLAEYRFAFYQLCSRQNYLDPEQARLSRQYRAAESALQGFYRERLSLSYSAQSVDDAVMLMELFYPESEALAWMHKLHPSSQEEARQVLERVYLQMLRKLASSLLTFRDGRIAIKTWGGKGQDFLAKLGTIDKVEIWSGISRRISCDTLAALFLVESGRTEPVYTMEQTSGIVLADKALATVLSKGIAETHVHFNAGADQMFVWLARMHPAQWEDCIREESSYQAACAESYATFPVMIYRMIWAEYLENLDLGMKTSGSGSFWGYCEKAYKGWKNEIEVCLSALSKGDVFAYRKEWSSWYTKILIRWKKATPDAVQSDRMTDFLMAHVYRAHMRYHSNSEILLLQKSFHYFSTERNCPSELHLFIQYIRCKNLFARQLVQNATTQGLDFFQFHYDRSVDRFWKDHLQGKEAARYTFLSFFQQDNLRKLEIRLGAEIRMDTGRLSMHSATVHDDLRRRYLHKIQVNLSAYRQCILQMAGVDEGELPGKSVGNGWERERKKILEQIGLRLDVASTDGELSVPTIGIIFHFIKQKLVDERVPDNCWLPESREFLRNGNNLVHWRESMIESAIVLEQLRSEIPLLGEYVVGIDAASVENQTEPWVFAPVFSRSRTHLLTNPLIESDGRIRRINNMGFTYHVGEEYRHLLTGLRHIDEVISHFSYKAGDRLGHAIALGTEPEVWLKQNSVLPVKKQEYLDDLLWLWGKGMFGGWNIHRYLPQIEGRIMKVAEEIYSDLYPPDIRILYEAYQMKFDSDLEDVFGYVREQYVDENIEKAGENESGGKRFCKYAKKESCGETVWNKHLIFCTWFCPIFRRVLNEPVLLTLGEDDQELLDTVRINLVEEIAKRGIYVETNPTSNVLIGSMDELKDHPIFRLYEQGLREDQHPGQDVMVTINSDDPLVFNTSTEDEFAYVYHALCQKGYPREKVLWWMDNVRRMGMDSSFIKKEKPPSQLLRELDELIFNISKYIK